MNKEQLRHFLQQPYQTDNWKKVIDFVFPNVSYFHSPAVLTHDNPKVDSFQQIGSVRLNDGKNLAMFEVKVAPNVNIPRNRVELRNLVAPLIDQERNHGVLVIYEQGKQDYRFTFTAKETSFDAEKSDFVSRETASKRFTYLLGANESCRTPGDRFWELSQKKEQATIKDVEHAFSVERLSKEFFPKYKQHYLNFVNYLNESNFKVTAFSNDEKQIRDFVKVLLGRIVFLHFVQKKGWLGASDTSFNDGDPYFLKHFWEQSGKNETFYYAHLSRLFFEGLNKSGRPNDSFLMPDEKTTRCVPYLGGGLFEKNRYEPDLVTFPPALFENLFNFFAEYNFTIDENDPYENEVGIDPEMLGHIFENLLEDNKDKGAFYTPKPIVKYMCQESLIQYLLTQLEQHKVFESGSKEANQFEKRIGTFVRHYEARDLIEYDDILAKALHRIKVCDPAIGSGAFPMGILNEMVMLINVLHKASPDVVENTWQMTNWQPATVKKHIIQNSIYGVDIEKGAVDIARLRFWLSLIIDEEHPGALPSLDYKIVVGNSLVSKLGEDVIDIDWSLESEALELFNEDLKERKKELLRQISLKQKQYYETTGDKHKLASAIRNLKIDLLINQLELMINKQDMVAEPVPEYYRNKPKAKYKEDVNKYLQCQGWEKQINRLKRIKAYPGEALDFFDWKLDFPEVLNELINPNVGFDVVIGNPPYRQLQKMGKESEILQVAGFETFARTGDIYSLFYEKGIHLLKLNGSLTYITSNKWMRAGYGRSTRNYFIQHNPLKLIDLGGGIFETATVDTNILILNKTQHKPTAFNLKGLNIANENRIRSFEAFADRWVTITELSDDSWTIASDIEQRIKAKIERIGKPLKEWDIKINFGIKTGFNEAFIIDEKKRDELIAQDPRSSEIIKPILRGKDIRRYKAEFANLWLINTHNGLKESNIPRINVENDYPAIYNHLKQFENQLKKRYDKGDHWTNLRNCAYINDFEKEKIVWKRIGSLIRFQFDDIGSLCLDSTCFLTGQNIKFLLAFLNSKLAINQLLENSPKTGTGDVITSVQAVEPILVPNVPVSQQKLFIELVDKILANKIQSKDTTTLEQQIDNLVYKLYNLTYAEVKIIDPDFVLSKEEYESLILE